MNRPIRFTHPTELQRMARYIQSVLDGITGAPNKLGFVLLMFPYEQDQTFGDFIATCPLDQVPKVLRESARSMENQQGDTNVTKQ